MIRHWTKDEEETLLKLKSKGTKLADIAVVLGRSTEAVSTRSKRLKARDTTSSVRGNFSWSEQETELLYSELDYNELEVLLPNRTRRSIMSKCEKLGISKRFPGVNNSAGTMDPTKETLLYLVDFGDFKKVGITQVGLETRFSQDKPYKILDTLLLDLEGAKSMEAEILRNMREFRVIGDIRRGGGECFSFDCNLLEELI